MRVVVVGGAGNFGARIVRALRGDSTIELMVTGRRAVSVPGAEEVPSVLIDIDGAVFAQAVKDLSPGLIIHWVGPFQGQDYRVANAALAAGAHYLDLADGRPFQVWRKGRWRRAWGWMELEEVRLDVGGRLAAACDVPDLELFPAPYPGIQTVRFSAALEFGVQHLTLWSLAALRRIGLPFPVARWAVSLNRFAGMFDAAAGEKGGMRGNLPLAQMGTCSFLHRIVRNGRRHRLLFRSGAEDGRRSGDCSGCAGRSLCMY